MPATTDIRGTSSPRSLSQNVVRGLAFEYEHEVLKGQYPQILTVRYRFPYGRPGSVHSGFKLSDHIVQAPPTLVATTSSLIYDVLVYSQIIHSTNPNPNKRNKSKNKLNDKTTTTTTTTTTKRTTPGNS